MARNFTHKFLIGVLSLAAFCGFKNTYAQQKPIAAPNKDSLTVKTPFKYTESKNALARKGIFDPVPFGVTRTIEYDAVTNKYVLYERIGNLLYRPPVYLTFDEYIRLKQTEEKRDYFKKLADNYAYQQQQPGFIPQINVHSQTFERIFGSSVIDIRPQGSAEAVMTGQINSNQNPLFNASQRTQFNFNFDQHIQLNVTGNIGDKLKIATNYNTDAQFQFDNQVKLDYLGHPDEIIQEIQAGTVSMPLNTSLITGTQQLFGIKTKLKFGKLNVTSILSQQRSQSKTITINNQGQQGNFSALASDYEANKHYFLSQYFRNNYNKALANIPIISSNINITKIEVWVTNRKNSTTDSRDVVGFLDLGENAPYNTTQIQGGAGFSGLPAGFKGPGFTDQSNSLLNNLPAGARLTNDPSNSLISYFAARGGTDNYAKLTYAQKLTPKEYTLHPQLGYISLNYPLNNDEVLAVAYQYSYNGKQYQVGEFSTDIPVDPTTPKVLYLKLLKNTLLKTNLPTWKLMMKNIYTLNAYQVSSTGFKLSIARLDDKSGIEKPIMEEGQNTKSKLWLQLTGLDNLNQQNEKQPDGYFDFLEGITIDSQNGRIMFPVIEPFGNDLSKQFNPGETDLIKRYVYQQIYDSTKTVAQQFFPQLNRYAIKGTYSAQGGGGVYQLNATNIPQGSVIVSAGASKLVEGTDYTIDYSVGRLNIINTAILTSGQPITVNLENNELFGVQQKSLFGSRFDYKVNPNLALGATIMHLSEQPISQNEAIGQESISNTIWGFDGNYSSNSRLLTRMVDKIPFIHTKAPSSVNFSGEFAQLLPGSPSVLNYAGSTNGTSYLDDFENSQSIIDVKSANTWQISATPQLFPEAALFDNLSYGYNRARLAFYNIDPIFYTNTSSTSVTRAQLSNHYARQVLQTEVFPYQQSVTGQPVALSTLDLAFYPTVRGPYNYTTNSINTDGSLQNPTSRWGGVYRGISSNDFQALNVQYIEFWVLDPFIYKPASLGGDMYFNLGSISEDVLKDGRKSLENGLPINGDLSTIDTTAWGRVPKGQPVVNAFDSNPSSRQLQDVGLDGLSDADEQSKFAPVIQSVKTKVTQQAANAFVNDPSSDDYQYYLGADQDAAKASILQRYAKYNGNESNSKTAQQSLALLGLQTSASTSLPDGEDIDHDNNMSQDDQYFQYKVSMRPKDLVVGQNFVNDKVTSQVKLADGSTQSVTWYQFRIPITAYQSAVGGIQDFKAIRFMRMFMTNFADTAVLRLATLQLVRGDWRAYNTENNPLNVIADPAITNPPLDNSAINVGTVNIEENGKRVPIPYMVPPGITRQRDYNNLQTNTQLNEQSLSLTITNLTDGYSRAAFKTFNNDLRKYKHLQMFIHAEANQTLLKDNDVTAFIRLGADYQDNYYEYEIPLAVTQPNTTNADAIWPTSNAMDIDLSLLTDAKVARNNAKYQGKPWPINVPFIYLTGNNKITIMGMPDLSRLATVMLGVRNPYRNNAPAGVDDGLAKSAIVWFDELRLTDFDNKGGWAAVARANFKLADFADITVSGSKSTAGFGTLDSKMEDRSLSDNQAYDISANMDLGKFLPAKSGVKIPTYINVSQQISTPQYDPAQPDILLKQTLNGATSTQQRDSIKNAAEDYTMRKSINFTNVHKDRVNASAPVHVYDVENFNATYAFTEYLHHDFTTQSDLEKTYHASLAYNFANKPKYISPFEKIIKNNTLALIRDINFSLAPTRLNFSIDFDRFYSEDILRNNDPNNPVFIPTTYNKSFNIRRVYGMGWNLTKSLTMDIDATNLSVVDEPYGKLDGLKMDTLWQNIRKLGRTTNYNHTFNVNYIVPLNKIPGFDWVSLTAHYSTNFNWQAAPEFAIGNPVFNVGNSIQNGRKIQLDPALNLTMLYNKIAFLKQGSNEKAPAITRVLVGLLTSIKNISGSYTLTEGTFLPGYLPQSNLFGEDLSYDAPGIGFLLGSQTDIRNKAVSRGWISSDTLQNQLYVKTYSSDLHLKASVEPTHDLRIQLTAFKTQDQTYQTNFKFLSTTGEFQDLSPITSGDYSISYFSLATAFSKESGVDNTSAPFQKFLDNRIIISRRLGSVNPNSFVPATGYADGYGPNSQNVLVPAFLAAYTGKNASGSSLSQFPNIPIPNWQLTYSGFGHMALFQELFDSFDVRNGYQSTYTVNGYNTLLQYQQTNGAASARDVNNDFLPLYQFSQITIFEQFVPLIGLDIRFKNNVTTSLEYRKSRALSLSLLNSQLTQQNENVITFGFGYNTKDFRFPFGLFSNFILKNDIKFKLDFALRDNKTLIYQSDVTVAQISSGAQNITYRPSIDYSISQRFNLSLFYDSNLTKPFTSQAFNTSFTNFGVNLKLLLQ
ncbi:cell surface protein SprA [Mucilaginibacter sp.]|uniref:T9SS outer membrane translocon Sov/SprA n=1 Tax=Mucilaginibacter sp. TaxID=1882438 RepID=UPI00262A0FF5|nr:cell surface protein SprA [Mucilaginibacter sp.]MDB5030903.1 cell surface protein SprA [Mucilaginibacter sp.]